MDIRPLTDGYAVSPQIAAEERRTSPPPASRP